MPLVASLLPLVASLQPLVASQNAFVEPVLSIGGTHCDLRINDITCGTAVTSGISKHLSNRPCHVVALLPQEPEHYLNIPW